MIFNTSSWLKRSFFSNMSLYYLVALFAFGIMQQHKLPAMPILFMQISAVFVIILFSYFYSKKSIGVTCTVVFVFQLFTMVALRIFNYDFFHDPLGYNPMDAEWYDWMARQFIHRSFSEFNMFLNSVDILLDDRGFNYIVLITYKLAGTPARGVNLLIFFNVIAVTASSYFMYKMAREFVDEKHANYTAFIWGTQLYSVYTGAVGLKENFMVCFIVISLYFIILLWREYTIQNVILTLLFAATALLFRTALFYILFVSFLTVTAIKFPFVRRYIIFFIIVTLVFTFFYIRQAAQEVSEIRGHAIDQETYETMVAGKMERSGTFASMVNYISALIGPFPNIVAQGDKANFITLFSFSSFCKTFYAFFFLYSLYLVIKNKVMKFIPLIAFWGLDILMLILTFYTLQDRYHWPHVPIVVLMSVWGGTQWMKSKPKNAIVIHRAYTIVLFMILIMFNYR